MQLAIDDLHYWTNVAPAIDFRIWTTASDAEMAERIRQIRIKDAKAYLKYLRNAGVSA